jgi:two-component system response regulator MprA
MTKRKVLIVDESQDCGELYKISFELDGWEAKLVTSAKLAQGQLEAFAPDAIILDSVLPDMPVDELIRTLRQNSKTKSTTIVVLTSVSLNPVEKDKTYSGADDAILKVMVMPKDLVKLVTKLLEKSREPLTDEPGVSR